MQLLFLDVTIILVLFPIPNVGESKVNRDMRVKRDGFSKIRVSICNRTVIVGADPILQVSETMNIVVFRIDRIKNFSSKSFNVL